MVRLGVTVDERDEELEKEIDRARESIGVIRESRGREEGMVDGRNRELEPTTGRQRRTMKKWRKEDELLRGRRRALVVNDSVSTRNAEEISRVSARGVEVVTHGVKLALNRDQREKLMK